MKEGRRIAVGLAFLAPNILGFLAFTLIPLVFAMVMAFTNWDLKLHNMFKDEPIRFVGLANFIDLVTQRDFWRFLGNTLFLMMVMPFAIAGSLVLALLLSKDLSGGNRRIYGALIAGAVMLSCVVALAMMGAGTTAMVIVLGGMACGMLLLGTLGGSTVYRTLFYLPHFTSGVAVFLLWKHLYNPVQGPINMALAPPLRSLNGAVNAAPAMLVQAGLWVAFALVVLLAAFGLGRLRQMWRDGELGWAGAILPVGLLLLPAVIALRWSPDALAGVALAAAALAVVGWQLYRAYGEGQDFPSAAGTGFGSGLMLAVALMTAQFALVGLGLVAYGLPAQAASPEGLQPPEWLAAYHWAKPALMIMMFWGAIGSNNMLLYLAGLSNVPPELYEAADIDGASRFQKFWNVTWPQLAPTTFFIVVMSVIGGLQGGFEMARTMTAGGPAGATTTLSYFIYSEGFETGRLGYSSAIAWLLFAMVFVVTMFNWRFGSRYVNE